MVCQGRRQAARSLSRTWGGLGKQTTWLHDDSMAEPNELSQRQRHSAGFYTARGGVSPQLQCMIKGNKTRGVVACAYDGCTAALPGQGHGIEPPAAMYRPSTLRRSCAPSPCSCQGAHAQG